MSNARKKRKLASFRRQHVSAVRVGRSVVGKSPLASRFWAWVLSLRKLFK